MPRGIDTRPPTPAHAIGFHYCVLCQNWYPPDDFALDFGVDFWSKRPYLMGFCTSCWAATHPAPTPVSDDDLLHL